MNYSINKTFYVCSAESLFFRYKKIFKKAVKLSSLYVLESIHKCIIELHVLQHLFVRESNKKTKEG